MKTQAEMNRLLSHFEKTYGIPIQGMPQGSESWFQVKLGVASASNAYKLVAKVDSDTRASYMAQLVAQVCTGIYEEINAKALEWGNTHEDAARSSYEFSTDSLVVEVPFVFKDESCRAGSSPDGLVGLDKGLELKCPFNSENYVKFLTSDAIKSEWKWQNQFNMWVTDAGTWDFGQYDPRMKAKPLHFITVERDEKMQKTLSDAVPQFISDMDKMLEKIGIKFGDHWLRISDKKAAV